MSLSRLHLAIVLSPRWLYFPQMTKIRKLMLIFAATVLTAVCIVIISILFWIKSNQGLQWIQSRINAEIPGTISIVNHQLSILQPSLNLEGVVLHDPEGLALAGFTRLLVELDWRALWRKEIRLQHILLQGPWVDLTMDTSNGLKLMAALVPPGDEKQTEPAATGSSGLPFNLVFASIQLVDGKITFAQPENSMHLESTGLNLTAHGDLNKQSARLELGVDNISFNSADIHLEPARVLLKASLQGEKLSVSTLRVTSGQTILSLSGTADGLYGSPVVDGTLTLDTQLAEVKPVFNLAGDYTGPVKGDLSFNGPVANPDARLAVTIGNSLLDGQPLDRGDLAIDLKDRLATIDTVALHLAEGSVKLNGTVNLRDAFPTGFLSPQADVNAIEYALTLVHDIPDLNRWLKPYVNLHGATSGRTTLTGKGIMPADISARLTMEGAGQKLLAPGMDRSIDAEVHLAAEMDHGTIGISRLKAATDGAELSGDGRFQIDKRAIEAKLLLTADDLSRVFAVMGMPSVKGACNATLAVDGSLSQPQFSLELASKNLKIEKYSLGDLAVSASMDHDGRLKLNTVNLQNGSSRLQGNGVLRLLSDGGGLDPDFVNELAVKIEGLSAADFMKSPLASGTLDGRLQVGGPLRSLTGELSLKGKRLGNDVATIGDLAAQLHLENGTVFVDRLHVSNKSSTFNSTGSIHLLTPGLPKLVEDPTLDFTFQSDHLDPGDFVETASGDFSFNGAVGGSIEKPSGQINLKGKQIKLADQTIDSLSVDARFKDKRLWLDQILAIVAPGGQLEGGGSVGMDKSIDLHVKSDGISITSIQPLQKFFPGEGTLHLNATGIGNIDNPDVEGQLGISDMTLKDEAMQDVTLTFGLHDMLAKVKGNLNFGVDATCNLKKGDFNARLLFDRTETAAYFRALGKPDFKGTLTGQVEAAGNINDTAHVSAQVDLDALQLFYKDISLVQSDRIRLKMADQEVTIPELELALLSSGRLRLKGVARIDGRLAMNIDGRIPLAAAEVFSEDLVDTTGVLVVKGDLSGDTADPQVDLRIDLENIGMIVPGLVQKLHDLNGTIHLGSDSVSIEGIKGFLDTGAFSMNGTIGHEKFTPTKMNIAIKAKALPLEVVDTMSVLLNGDVNITGNDRSAAATGEIVLLEGVYYKDVKINLLEMATDRSRTVTPKSTPMALPGFDTVKLDIKVKSRQPFFVENNMAELEISPDLRVAGTLERPIINGRAQVKSGTITFQKKIFNVKKGIIDFTNPYKTEAKIDIESETTIRSWTITLAVKGTPDNLELKLSSVPTENDSDILSLILFGRTAQEIASGESGGKRSTSEVMASMLADTFGEDIKKAAGVDILQMETDDSSDGQNGEGVKVTVGKHLSDRMTVKYAVESKDGEIVQRAITEYKLLENILVSGFQDNQGIFGAELVFRIEFR